MLKTKEVYVPNQVKEIKTIEEFQTLTGWQDGDAIRKLLVPYGLENNWDIEDDGGIETGWLPELSLFVKDNPSYKILTQTEDEDNNPVYSNEVHYVNRIKYYLGLNGVAEVLDFTDMEFAEMKEEEEECMHDEHDHGYCIDCGEDINDSLVGAAEAAYEGDR